MSNTENFHCRLCAELKPHNELTNMQTDKETCQKVVNKLSRFNIVMNFQENILPKTVCSQCVISLEKAFSFVTAVEQSQKILSEFDLIKTNTLKLKHCDDISFVLPTEIDKEIDLKVEISCDATDSIDDETNLGEDWDYENVCNDDKNANSEKVNREKSVATESFYVAVEEKVNLKDETDIVSINNIQENESLNVSNECKYNHNINIEDNNLNIKDTEMLSEFNDKLIKGLETGHNCEEIPSSNNTDVIQPLLISLPPKLGSTVYSEEYVNKKINRLCNVPVQYLNKTWMEYEWKCSHCGTLFSNIEELQKHSIMYHRVCNAYQCTDCKTKKQRLNAFIKHVQSHRKYLHYSCYKCFEKFPYLMETRYHKMEVHENSKYLCLGCNTPFPSNAELKKHVDKYYNLLWKKKTFINPDNLTCGSCNKGFTNIPALRNHLNAAHKPKRRDHICDRCGKCFDSKKTLQTHMDTHNDKVLYHCEICKATFKTVYSLRYHASIHSGIKPFTCDVCSKCYRTKSQITSHMKFHSDYFPFPCTVCSKKFRTDNNLRNHMYQHTGAKPFTCDVCPREFTNLSNRNKHMRRRHGLEMAKKRQPIIKQLTADDPSPSDLEVKS